MDIVLTNVTFVRKDRYILKNISFSFSTEGNESFIGLIGRNGSGKSTLIKILSGIIDYTYGFIGEKVFVNDRLYYLRKLSQDAIRLKLIGILFQRPDNQIINSIVENDIAFGLENENVARKDMLQKVTKVLEYLNILKLRNRDVNTLSGGEKQLVAIAGMLVLNYPFLLFDEVTSMLDIKNSNLVISKIKELNDTQKLGIIFVTHKMEFLKFMKKILILDKGEVAFFGTKINNEILGKFKLG